VQLYQTGVFYVDFRLPKEFEQNKRSQKGGKRREDFVQLLPASLECYLFYRIDQDRKLKKLRPKVLVAASMNIK
jgi:hypothetical protein